MHKDNWEPRAKHHRFYQVQKGQTVTIPYPNLPALQAKYPYINRYSNNKPRRFYV